MSIINFQRTGNGEDGLIGMDVRPRVVVANGLETGIAIANTQVVED